MTQKSEPKDILDQMLFQYPNAAVVLTLGEKGAWYARREERYFCPAQKVQAVDTTAAGDTFTGYFLMAQGKGFSAEQCLSIAAQATTAIASCREWAASVSVPVWAELADGLINNSNNRMHARRAFCCHESKTPDGVIFQTLSGVDFYNFGWMSAATIFETSVIYAGSGQISSLAITTVTS